MKKKTLFCKVCGSSVYDLEDLQFEEVYIKCTVCGFIHLKSEYYVSYEEERAEYDLHENSADDSGYVAYLERFLERAVDPFVKDGDALDFGCGPEPVLAMCLKRRGFSVSVYDKHFSCDENALEKAYDLITSTEVFEHFHEPKEEMKRIVDRLQPGGVLAIMTSAPPEDEAFQNWHYRREKTHISFYTLKSLEVLAEAFGLEIVFHGGKNVTVFRKRFYK